MKASVKRLLTHLLAAALSLALGLQPALAASQPQLPEGHHSSFSDVGENQWFYPYVFSLYDQGVVSGYPDGRFGPDDVTRAGDTIIMVLRAAGCPTMEPPQDAHYATGYQNYAVSQGWLTWGEIPDLTAPISRLLVAQLAARALGLTASASASPFADLEDGCATAMYEAGLISGSRDEDGVLRYKPQDSITRAEISAIVWQVQQYASSIHFAGQVLAVLDGVPASGYDRAAFALQNGRMTYTGQGAETSLGVDVSSLQGEINWRQVARDGMDFAMIRAAGRYYGLNSGTIFEDTRFRTNLRGAQNAGLEVGVYFFSQAITVEEAEEEARFLLDLLAGQEIDGPVAFDWEYIDNDTARTDNVTGDTITAMANAFCRVVEEGGYQPMVYFNPYTAYLHYDLEAIAQYPFWLAEYNQTPQFYYDYQMWQYTETGRVEGIGTAVDINIRMRPW